MRVISDSQVGAYATCTQKFQYSYVENLKRIGSSSRPLEIGTMGHSVLEQWYRTDFDADAALKVLMGYLADGVDMEHISVLRQVMPRYFEHYGSIDSDIKILDVEGDVILPLTNDYAFSGILDLLYEQNGEIILMDHKFCYNFMSLDEERIAMGQLMKYAAGVQNMIQRKVDWVCLNLVRYRLKKGGNTDAELFRRVRVKPQAYQLRGHMKNQILLSEKILKFMENPDPVRVLSRPICKNCDFLNLCLAELEGQDTTYMRLSEFSIKGMK